MFEIISHLTFLNEHDEYIYIYRISMDSWCRVDIVRTILFSLNILSANQALMN